MPDDFDYENPRSRNEIYYAAALGYYDGELPKPVSRADYYLKEIAENGTHQSGGGILVQTIDQTTPSLTTTRPDGTPLENEDYIKAKPSATFPFDIGGFTIDNKFTKLLWFNGEWILDAGLIQDSSEVPLKDSVYESLDETNPDRTQKEVNKHVKDAIRNIRKHLPLDLTILIEPAEPENVVKVDEYHYLSAYNYVSPIKFTCKASSLPFKVVGVEFRANGLYKDGATVDWEYGGEFVYNGSSGYCTSEDYWSMFVIDEYGNRYESERYILKAQGRPEYSVDGTNWIKLPINKDYKFTFKVNLDNQQLQIRTPKSTYGNTGEIKIFASNNGNLSEDYTESFSHDSWTLWEMYKLKTPVTVNDFEFTICEKH